MGDETKWREGEEIIIYEHKCTIRTLDTVPIEEEEEWDDVDDDSWRE